MAGVADNGVTPEAGQVEGIAGCTGDPDSCVDFKCIAFYVKCIYECYLA